MLGGQGHKCYHVPGAGPVKTCKSEQYYNLLLPKSLELPFKNACTYILFKILNQINMLKFGLYEQGSGD